jgi:hypothetical protein
MFGIFAARIRLFASRSRIEISASGGNAQLKEEG